MRPAKALAPAVPNRDFALNDAGGAVDAQPVD
jgi:hypothetical protein